jgi:uncharacterized membrane protein YobD (UPF0266 family)
MERKCNKIHNLIFILYYYFKFDIENPLLKSKYKINNKTGIKIFSENIIYLLIYNKITNKCFEKIHKILNIIELNVVYIFNKIKKLVKEKD